MTVALRIGKKNMHEQPVVNLVDDLLQEAIARSASDIHLEPMADKLRVRIRLDGVLHDVEPIALDIMPQVLSRIKVLAHINIAEKRMPQDGKFSVVDGKGTTIDLRVATFPCVFGEKMVVRILDRTTHMIALDQLGFAPEMLALFNSLIAKPYGLILVTGPTGSGKTTTLYAVLSALNDAAKNIVTLEDPVEYSLTGITQGQINTDAGFTFDKGIRSVLRQDPDILMVGEIRDRETARVAIEAALTGHLVLSTLHTNDAPGTFMRLIDMGIEPFLINASLIGVLAQRLVRTICTACRQPVSDDTAVSSAKKTLSGFEIAQHFIGKGCAACDNIGYKGRTGIFELLHVSPTLHDLVLMRPMHDVIRAHAIANGMQTLGIDGARKVANGVIAMEELARVIH